MIIENYKLTYKKAYKKLVKSLGSLESMVPAQE